VRCSGDVYFTDIVNNRILKLDGKTGRYQSFREPSGRANGLLFDAQGRLLACEGNEFCPNDGNRRVTRTDLKTGVVEVLVDRWQGKRLNSPNDIAACSKGVYSSRIHAISIVPPWNWITIPFIASIRTAQSPACCLSPKSNDPMESPSAPTNERCTLSIAAL